jgi:hypothetical protein
MTQIKFILVILMLIAGAAVTSAQETGRIKRKPPTAAEVERMALEMAKNDALLQKGDIIATDRGFLVFRGAAADGMSNEFAPIPNPISSVKK